MAQKPLSLGQSLLRADSQRPYSVPTSVSAQSLKSAASPAPESVASDNAPANLNVIALKDEQGKDVKPSAMLAYDRDLLFLSPNRLWISPGAVAELGSVTALTVKKIEPPKSFGSLKFQEFNTFALFPARKSIIVLDKSGDLYEYSPATNKWQLFRANLPFLKGQPDPEFIDLSIAGKTVILLDPERNQIWQTYGGAAHMDGYLKDILPWRIKPGDTYVGDGLSMAADNGTFYVLKKYGAITKFSTATGAPGSHQLPFHHKRLSGMRPSRLSTATGAPLYVVERENNRVLAIDKTTGHISQFLFAGSSDLRGLLPIEDGFWILNSGKLLLRKLAQPDSIKVAFQRRGNDERLDGMIIPIQGVALPRHVGVFPGARRLYRFGIHEGMDFFLDPGSKTQVTMGTPVRATDGGKVLRADANFKDMTYPQFNRVMNECYKEHRTSDRNEDLFRGCQVWIGHGNGLMTRYAHLSKISPVLKKDQLVSRGDLIAFVGVSGTGQNLPGRTKYPHLHFEIWLDGKYLGWGLTPAETMGVYEDIFGNGAGG